MLPSRLRGLLLSVMDATCLGVIFPTATSLSSKKQSAIRSWIWIIWLDEFQAPKARAAPMSTPPCSPHHVTPSSATKQNWENGTARGHWYARIEGTFVTERCEIARRGSFVSA
ncbi:hypothetical protein EDB80DRAFT_710771 [Ilyonectria destructans]|nr:hypothetical protein EDB80DRAFT_710771 [Ilyonectria destructans]